MNATFDQPVERFKAATQMLTLAEADQPFPRLASITRTGRDVLARRVEYLSLHPPMRWGGGGQVIGHWRWDESLNATAPSA